MACTETYATLRIFSDEMHPDEIEKYIGIQSTDSVPRDPNSKYKPRRELNFWSRTTEVDLNSTDNVKHLELLLSLLNGKEGELSSLRDSGCSTDIFCRWDSTGQGGPRLSVAMMKELVKYGLGISWDMYFDEEENA
ncbi:DUF4279 domain-containing protein [Simiduia curdlanivorans]|uniref:DUF4279 domain-containing protein n=1 Tax=Simiduia curdlanivorans TaxID=1492769 RepID=A0ABV8V1Q3_9GAMM|nr:DUF4279 domain-containing protein [Simiduia curdlanivorans]MDN3637697.1 DUF4279 domain-containing protein [Simiduia curdlanivorans]